MIVKKLLLTILIIALLQPVIGQPWKIVKDNLEYDFIYPCKDGMFKVKKNNRFGFLNKMGVEVFAPTLLEAKDYANGLAVVKSTNQQWGIIDATGKWKVKPEYKRLADKAYTNFFVFYDTTAKVYGAKDYAGNVIIPAKYNEVSGNKNFIRTHKNKYTVAINNPTLYGLYTTKGDEILPTENDNILLDTASDIAIVRLGEKYKVVDVTGHALTEEFVNWRILNLKKNVLLVQDKQTKLYGLSDKKGKLIVACKYAYMEQQNERDNQIYLATLKTNIWGKEETKYGVIDRTGKELIPFNYYYISSYRNGLAFARETFTSKVGYFNTKGVVAIPFKYETADYFQENQLAKVTIENSGGKEERFINKQGVDAGKSIADLPEFFEGVAVRKKPDELVIIDKAKVQKKVEGAVDQWNISEGLFKVKNNEGKYGFADLNGKLVIPCKYDYAGFFKSGLATVGKKVGSKILYGYINKTGKEIVPPKLKTPVDFADGYALVTDEQGETFFINTKGERQSPAKAYTEVFDFSNGFAVAKARVNGEDNYAFLGKNLKEVFVTASKSVYFFNGGYALLFDKDYTIINSNFKATGTLKKDETDSILMFSEGLIGVKDKATKKWGFKNEKGITVIEPAYISIRKFQEGVAAVLTDKGWGYINKKGTVVIQPQYQELWPFNEGLAKVKKDNFYGYIDKTGNYFIKPKYNRITEFEKGKAVIKLEDLYQLVKLP